MSDVPEEVTKVLNIAFHVVKIYASATGILLAACLAVHFIGKCLL